MDATWANLIASRRGKRSRVGEGGGSGRDRPLRAVDGFEGTFSRGNHCRPCGRDEVGFLARGGGGQYELSSPPPTPIHPDTTPRGKHIHGGGSSPMTTTRNGRGEWHGEDWERPPGGTPNTPPPPHPLRLGPQCMVVGETTPKPHKKLFEKQEITVRGGTRMKKWLSNFVIDRLPRGSRILVAITDRIRRTPLGPWGERGRGEGRAERRYRWLGNSMCLTTPHMVTPAFWGNRRGKKPRRAHAWIWVANRVLIGGAMGGGAPIAWHTHTHVNEGHGTHGTHGTHVRGHQAGGRASGTRRIPRDSAVDVEGEMVGGIGPRRGAGGGMGRRRGGDTGGGVLWRGEGRMTTPDVGSGGGGKYWGETRDGFAVVGMRTWNPAAADANPTGESTAPNGSQ